MAEPSLGRQFGNGILAENPVFVQVLGTCPTLAITSSVANALTMGAATMFVLICSNIMMSLIRKQLRPHVRILVYMITIASFCTIVDYLLQALVFNMSIALGPYIPLIIVNCIILARAEMCASKSTVVRSAVDAVGMGIGFTVALTLIGAIREILGTSSILGHHLPLNFTPWCVMILPSGAFLTFGIVMGVINWLKSRKTQEA